MTKEQETLDQIFDSGHLWKNKYKVSWCDHCEAAVITCEVCKNSSCNGGGCFECGKDFKDFSSNYIYSFYAYLHYDQLDSFFRAKKLRELIVKSISRGEFSINWQSDWIKEELSKRDRELFKEFVYYE